MYSSIKMVESTFKEQKEEIQATFNIDKDEVGIQSIADDERVDVIIKLKTKQRGSSMVQTLSNVDVNIEKLGVMGIKATKEEVEYYKQHPDVEYVEPNYAMHVLEDPVYERNLAEEEPYGISMVLQDMGFWKDLGPPSGESKVCVVDTGYYLGHQDLPDGDDVNGESINGYGDWHVDGHGHGTHCSGTVAAIGDNSAGVVGVIPDNMGGNFQLLISNGLSPSGSGSTASVMQAVENCVDLGANVVSLSLGGAGFSQSSFDQFKLHYEQDDVLFVAAAGNGGNSAYSYPASYDHVMSVAAINSNKNKAGFSQYNDQVEISAPGVSVKSTIPNNLYASWSGTSMATPHVAGVAGLLRAYFPDCSSNQIRNVLLATAEDRGSSGCDHEYGYGIVRAKDAFMVLNSTDCGGIAGYPSAVGGCPQGVGCETDNECDDSYKCVDGGCKYYECDVDSDCDVGNACTTNTCNAGTCEASYQCSDCGKSTVTVEITTDNYPAETSYHVKDDTETYMSGGSYSLTNTPHVETTCLGAGDYTFTIHDSYGDGLCCNYGSGSYSVKVDDNVIASGASFQSSESADFTVATLAPTMSASPSLSMSPSMTKSPTRAPTRAPTKAPTRFPTKPPTRAPTRSPTKDKCKKKNQRCKRNSDCCKKKCKNVLGYKFCKK